MKFGLRAKLSYLYKVKLKQMKEYKVKVYEDFEEWFNLNGQYHREDGPAVKGSNGFKEWWVNNQLHREDGPAVECSDGYKAWYLNGQRHREDGPAVEWANGNKEWYLNNQRLTLSEFNARMNPIELTMDQIAALAGVDVSRLKIKK